MDVSEDFIEYRDQNVYAKWHNFSSYARDRHKRWATTIDNNAKNEAYSAYDPAGNKTENT